MWTRICKSLKNTCKETKLKEFQFKLIHRSIVTKKELFRFGIKTDDECLYCGDKDSTEHSCIECASSKLFTQTVLNWFYQVNKCQISPTTEETLFGITASSLDTTIIRKFNYTALFMRHYIYLSKLLIQDRNCNTVTRVSRTKRSSDCDYSIMTASCVKLELLCYSFYLELVFRSACICIEHSYDCVKPFTFEFVYLSKLNSLAISIQNFITKLLYIVYR